MLKLKVISYLKTVLMDTLVESILSKSYPRHIAESIITWIFCTDI